jgi:hypothetical protein
MGFTALIRPFAALRGAFSRKRGEGQQVSMLVYVGPSFRVSGEGSPFGFAQGKLRPREGRARPGQLLALSGAAH